MSPQQRSVNPHQRQVLRQRARGIRHTPTESEWLLWLSLRQRQLGVTFRRQVVLQGYVADFYACSAKLIVELDGSWHDQRTHRDARRERTLRAAGAHEVVHALPQVVTRVRQALGQS